MRPLSLFERGHTDTTTACWETIRDASSSRTASKPARTTTIPYMDLLTALRILDPIEAWLPTQNHFSRLNSAPKHHLADPALAARLLERTRRGPARVRPDGRCGVGAGTVGGAMDTPDETPQPDADATPAARRSRGLDRRTVALCVCIALVAAIAAGLLVSVVVGYDSDDANANAQQGATLQRRGEIDPKELAAVELLTVDGAKTRLSELVGDKATVVNLWAQWCVPCIKEMPWLEQTSRDNPDVAFLGVNILDRLDNAQAMAAKTGITYPWVRDEKGDFGNAAQSTGLPYTLLLATDGTVLASKLGAFESQAEIQAWLDQHLP